MKNKNTRTISRIALLLAFVMLMLGATTSFVSCDTYDDLPYEQEQTSQCYAEDESVYDTIKDDAIDPPQDQPLQIPDSSEETQTIYKESDTGSSFTLDISNLPIYSGTPFVAVNDNIPSFSDKELTLVGYEQYSDLDSLGRCGVALASCGKEIMPKADEERGSISSITPSGWVQAKYDGISGGYLWNRCHLIGWQLSAENANKNNLITGTRYMNVEGMLPFENMVADYINETGNHVAYRVTPIFEGKNLVCSGVQIEAYSIEDKGEAICFNVYCFNVQPGITIDYLTGKSSGDGKVEETTEAVTTAPNEPTSTPEDAVMVWVTSSGKKYHSNSSCSNMKSPQQITLGSAKSSGREPCSKCY